jgi:hypothetical protein
MLRKPHCLDNRLTVNCEILATCSSTYSPVRTSQEAQHFKKICLDSQLLGFTAAVENDTNMLFIIYSTIKIFICRYLSRTWGSIQTISLLHKSSNFVMCSRVKVTQLLQKFGFFAEFAFLSVGSCPQYSLCPPGLSSVHISCPLHFRSMTARMLS